MLINELKEVICTEDEINEICDRLAKEVSKQIESENEMPIFLGLLKGCHPFMSELMVKIPHHIEIDYMDVSSYFGGTKSQEEVTIIKDMTLSVKGRNIYIIEDIVDSGRTIAKVKELLKFRGAKDVKIVSFLDKPSGRSVDLAAEYVGLVVPNAFLVGYGLDYNEKFRNLKAVGIPKDEVIKGE